jgi:hypothetical protein
MKVKMFISLFAIGLLAFNFSFKNEKKRNERLTLQNIAIMQANAGEAYCDQCDASGCVIIIEVNGRRIVGTSTGTVVGYF